MLIFTVYENQNENKKAGELTRACTWTTSASNNKRVASVWAAPAAILYKPREIVVTTLANSCEFKKELLNNLISKTRSLV